MKLLSKTNMKQQVTCLALIILAMMSTAYMSYTITSKGLRHNTSVYRTIGALNNLDDIKKGDLENLKFRESVLVFSVILNIEVIEEHQSLCSSITENLNNDIVLAIEQKTKIPVNQKKLFNLKFEQLRQFCSSQKTNM